MTEEEKIRVEDRMKAKTVDKSPVGIRIYWYYI